MDLLITKKEVSFKIGRRFWRYWYHREKQK